MPDENKGRNEVRWYNAPSGRLGILVLAILVVGGGWWYTSKRSDCLSRITYHPAQKSFGDTGAYYQLRAETALGNLGGGAQFQTHDEAISTCIWL